MALFSVLKTAILKIILGQTTEKEQSEEGENKINLLREINSAVYRGQSGQPVC